LVESLKKACIIHNVNTAHVSGIGATDSFKCGVYNIENKSYKEIEFNGMFEILSLSGSVTQKNNEPYIHVHICASDENGSAIGGHLIDARVSVTCELTLLLSDSVIKRFFDESVGINLLEL